MTQHNIIIREKTTGEVVKRITCGSPRSQDRCARGASINLNHKEFEILYEDVDEDGKIETY